MQMTKTLLLMKPVSDYLRPRNRTYHLWALRVHGETADTGFILNYATNMQRKISGIIFDTLILKILLDFLPVNLYNT